MKICAVKYANMQFGFNSTQAQKVELNQCNFNENMQICRIF